MHKQEFAHDESIWCVAWGRTRTGDGEKSDTEMKEGDEDAREKANDGELNDFIVTGSLDDTVKIWDVKGDRLDLQQQLSGHSLGVVSVAVSSDGKTIASSSLDSGLCIWKTETGQMLNQAALGPVDLWTVAFSPDDKYVISGSHEGKISLYDVETAKPEQVLDPQNGKFTLSIAYVCDLIHFFHLLSARISIFCLCTLRVPMANTLPVVPLTELSIFLMWQQERWLRPLKDTLCLCEVCASHPILRCF